MLDLKVTGYGSPKRKRILVSTMATLSHVDSAGNASMVDISAKQRTARVAVAEATLRMQPRTLDLIDQRAVTKGDVLAVARVAGIQAAKRTSELIPLCHALALEKIDIDFTRVGKDVLRIESRCKLSGKTGVEMEAMTAASVAALTIYDMCKGVEKGIEICGIRLLSKSGGKSGDWKRP